MLPEQLDPAVAALVQQMPEGAISNPIRVPGGYEIVTLEGQRPVGNELATLVTLRAAFAPFTTKLDPQAPTAQQQQALLTMQKLSRTAKSCDDIEAANKSLGEVRPSNPGQVRLDALNPQMQSLLNGLQVNQPTRALVTPDGVIVLMVCSREQKNLAQTSREDIANQLLQERVELASRQLEQDLKRRALIDERNS
jgi:peptidyl-prolyl cis-trans isomerase SurA